MKTDHSFTLTAAVVLAGVVLALANASGDKATATESDTAPVVNEAPAVLPFTGPAA
jgi:hypothetical protein